MLYCDDCPFKAACPAETPGKPACAVNNNAMLVTHTLVLAVVALMLAVFDAVM